MLKGNKGEWSEIYTFVYLLTSGKLYAADKDLNINPNIYFPIIKIIREETAGEQYDYCTGPFIKIYLNGELVKEISREKFDEIRQVLLDKIPQGQRAFEIQEVEEFFNSINCTKLKANSSKKQDITIKIHDINTGFSPICGFSIKSYIGSNPTLVNAGTNTNFIYTIKGCTDEVMNTVNSIDTRTKINDRMEYLSDYELVPVNYYFSGRFKENLEFIDTIMPKFLSFMVLYSYKFNLKNSADIIAKMRELNPLGFSNPKMYDYKYKKFLCAMALGMTPEKDWEGQEDASGGYIVVKKDGDVVCYHIYNREDFEQYLFDYTFFDRASTSRHGFMSVYKENSEYKINLNLQIRFR